MTDSGWVEGGPNSSPGGGDSPPVAGAGYPPAGGYPSTTGVTALSSDPSYPVTAGIDAPLEVARWRVIGNPILAIPHFVFLYVLEFWAVRVSAWYFLLADPYPPFRIA